MKHYILCLSTVFLLATGSLSAQFIGADFHYEIGVKNTDDTIASSMLDAPSVDLIMDPNQPVTYKVTLKLYFHCMQSDFPNEQPVTVHEHVGTMQTGEYTLKLDSVSEAKSYLSVSCELANEQCLKIATYSAIIDIKNMAGGYDITWGTCCWNHSVTNITNLEMQGLAMTLHVPESMGQQKNSSPVFIELPQTLTCPDKIMIINSMATDKEGDKLVYSLIHPNTFQQANNMGQVDHSDLFPGQNNYKPLVVGRPPFKNIIYNEGFSSDSPLGESIFKINPETGSIDVQAKESGHYIVGIGVSEYRNNILLGETQRVVMFEVVADPFSFEEIK